MVNLKFIFAVLSLGILEASAWTARIHYHEDKYILVRFPNHMELSSEKIPWVPLMLLMPHVTIVPEPESDHEDNIMGKDQGLPMIIGKEDSSLALDDVSGSVENDDDDEDGPVFNGTKNSNVSSSDLDDLPSKGIEVIANDDEDKGMREAVEPEAFDPPRRPDNLFEFDDMDDAEPIGPELVGKTSPEDFFGGVGPISDFLEVVHKGVDILINKDSDSSSSSEEDFPDPENVASTAAPGLPTTSGISITEKSEGRPSTTQRPAVVASATKSGASGTSSTTEGLSILDLIPGTASSVKKGSKESLSITEVFYPRTGWALESLLVPLMLALVLFLVVALVRRERRRKQCADSAKIVENLKI